VLGNEVYWVYILLTCNTLKRTATQNALQHAASQRNAVQHSATRCNTLNWYCVCIFKKEKKPHVLPPMADEVLVVNKETYRLPSEPYILPKEPHILSKRACNTRCNTWQRTATHCDTHCNRLHTARAKSHMICQKSVNLVAKQRPHQ